MPNTYKTLSRQRLCSELKLNASNLSIIFINDIKSVLKSNNLCSLTTI
jgi:hypothetical protein